jgi:hypothetical protein
VVYPFRICPGNQFDETQIVRGKRKVAMARRIGSANAFEDGFVIVRKEGLQMDIIGDLEINPVVNVKCLIQEGEIQKRNNQK